MTTTRSQRDAADTYRAGTADAPTEQPLRRDAERNRQRIIQAAREVFAARGLGAGLNDVAHHAGLGIGTVYRRFPDKDLLIQAALQEQVYALAAVVEEGLAAASAWDGLTFLLHRAAAMHVASRGLRDIALSSGRGLQQLDAIRARTVPRLEQLVRRAHEEGAVRPDVTAADLIMILFMVTELAHHSLAVNPDAYHRYLDLLIGALRPQPTDALLTTTVSTADAMAIADHWVGTDR